MLKAFLFRPAKDCGEIWLRLRVGVIGVRVVWERKTLMKRTRELLIAWRYTGRLVQPSANKAFNQALLALVNLIYLLIMNKAWKSGCVPTWRHHKRPRPAHKEIMASKYCQKYAHGTERTPFASFGLIEGYWHHCGPVDPWQGNSQWQHYQGELSDLKRRLESSVCDLLYLGVLILIDW